MLHKLSYETDRITTIAEELTGLAVTLTVYADHFNDRYNGRDFDFLSGSVERIAKELDDIANNLLKHKAEMRIMLSEKEGPIDQ